MADEKAEQEHEDTVPARIHEQLRQVMLGERRRAEKAELERDAARDSKNDAIFEIHRGHANDLADALGCVNEHEGARQQPPWAEMIGMVERIRRERDDALSADYHCPQCGEALVQIGQLHRELVFRRDPSSVTLAAEECGWNGVENPKGLADFIRHLSEERDAALARVRELEAKLAESESNSAWLDRAQKLSEQLDAIATGADKADAEELAAWRWLMGWLDRGATECSRSFERICGILFVFEWRRESEGTFCYKVAEAPTTVALATALDPNWRKAGSKEQDT